MSNPLNYPKISRKIFQGNVSRSNSAETFLMSYSFVAGKSMGAQIVGRADEKKKSCRKTLLRRDQLTSAILYGLF